MLGKKLEKSSKKSDMPENTKGIKYYRPAVDVIEYNDEIKCIFDIPGSDKDKIDINITDDIMTLTAEVTSNIPEKAKIIHQEYKTGAYKRSFTIGNKVDRNNVNAAYKNGVLTVTLKHLEEVKPKQIEIKAE